MFRSIPVVVVMIVAGTLLSQATAAKAADRGHVIAGHSVNTHVLTPYYGQWVTVCLEGLGSSDLDLFVFDEDGREVTRDDDATNIGYARFRAHCKRYFLFVKNCDCYSDFYTLKHN